MKVEIKQNQLRRMYNGRLFILPDWGPLWNVFHRYAEPRFYNAGVYGWNFDAYELGDSCLVSGYRPIGQDAGDILKRFEARAKRLDAASRDFSTPYDKLKKRAARLFSDIEKALNA